MSHSSYQKQFVKLIMEISRHRRPYETFRDFVTMAACSIHNALSMNAELESLYLQTIQRYEKDVHSRFAELLGLLTMGLEAPHDFLGSVFMQMELGNAGTGQYFTPYHISLLNAKLIAGETRETVLQGKPYITVSDPASGAGGMIIAFYEVMLKAGLNPQQEMWAHCTDIDPVAAYMSYLQLALLHIPAVVITGCSLRQSIQRLMYTPAHILGGWSGRLKRAQAEATAQEILTEGPAEPVRARPLVLPVAQMGLFEFV